METFEKWKSDSDAMRSEIGMPPLSPDVARFAYDNYVVMMNPSDQIMDRVRDMLLSHAGDCADPEHSDSIKNALIELAEIAGKPESWWSVGWDALCPQCRKQATRQRCGAVHCAECGFEQDCG